MTEAASDEMDGYCRSLLKPAGRWPPHHSGSWEPCFHLWIHLGQCGLKLRPHCLPRSLCLPGLQKHVKMPKSPEALPSFSQRLFLLLPFHSAHKVLSFVETKSGRGKRKTQVAVICR